MSWYSRSLAPCLTRAAAIPARAQFESPTGDRENPEYEEALDRPAD
jgi:hypothetical protein